MFTSIVRQSIRTNAQRNYATTPQAFNVFNREAKKLQKDRAAMNAEESRTVDYLKDEIAARVADRLLVKLYIIYFYRLNTKKKFEIGYQSRF